MHIDSNELEAIVGANEDRLLGFGGNPDDVASDWVSAFSPTRFWRPVPVATATYDAANSRWMSEWIDPNGDD